MPGSLTAKGFAVHASQPLSATALGRLGGVDQGMADAEKIDAVVGIIAEVG